MTEWKQYKIGDLCESISDAYKGLADDVILINTSDVLDGKVLNHSAVKNCNLKGQFKKTFKRNDILYSEIRPANRRFAFVDFDNTEQYIASTKLMVIRANTTIINPLFLFIVLTSHDVINHLQLLAETRSGTFPQITFSGELAQMEIGVPNLEVQNRIVNIWNAVDNKIATNRTINNNLAA